MNAVRKATAADLFRALGSPDVRASLRDLQIGGNTNYVIAHADDTIADTLARLHALGDIGYIAILYGDSAELQLIRVTRGEAPEGRPSEQLEVQEGSQIKMLVALLISYPGQYKITMVDGLMAELVRDPGPELVPA